MSEVTGWGIVGCGDVANRKSGPSFSEVSGSRLVSVMRRTASAAQSFAREHGAAHWSTDASEVIDHPEVTAVYIATPPAHHLEYALAVCAAGKACLVEKPAGRSLAEFRQMHRAFRAAGLPLYVSFYRRYLPRFAKVRELLRSGALGEIIGIDYQMNKRYRRGAAIMDVAASGGGHFYELACHMLDLFDDWFGPLEFVGASATNRIPRETAEDAVALSFRTPGGAVAACLWNFAASSTGDQLVIEGTRGRVSMRGTAVDKPVRVDFDVESRVRTSQSRTERWLVEWRDRLGLGVSETFRFEKVRRPHAGLIEDLSARLAARPPQADNADAALRTAEVVDRALAPYYRGRDDAFWTRPATWQSLQANASRANQGPLPPAYQISDAELRRFETEGYIGPYRCEADWQHLIVPVKKGRNRHLEEADVFRVCTHPSVIRRVAQVMGDRRFSLFKTRFVVKMPRSQAVVAWHQDVGDRNGGFTPDGKAVPTLAVWMGIDGIDPENGGLEVIPGSHRRLLGDYNKQIKSGLVEEGVLSPADLERAVPVLLQPGEFIIYHGWLLHGSSPNTSARRRAGLNMRFAPNGLECEDEFVYIPIETAEVPRSDRVFMNDTWDGQPPAASPTDAVALARTG